MNSYLRFLEFTSSFTAYPYRNVPGAIGNVVNRKNSCHHLLYDLKYSFFCLACKAFYANSTELLRTHLLETKYNN